MYFTRSNNKQMKIYLKEEYQNALTCIYHTFIHTCVCMQFTVFMHMYILLSSKAEIEMQVKIERD